MTDTQPRLFSVAVSPDGAVSYPESPGYKTGGTSQDAAEEIEDRAETLRGMVLERLKAVPSTADEVAEFLGESVLSIRPRISELAVACFSRPVLVVSTGDRRKNASGKMAKVWRAVG